MKTVFLTFGTEEIKGSRTRLKYRAIETGWFDKVYSIDESFIKDEKFLSYKESHWEEPYHGWYFWKPFAILSVFDELEYGDVLVYGDAGDDINLEGKRFFEQKIKLLDNCPIVAYGMTSIGGFSSSQSIVEVIGKEGLCNDVFQYPQIQSGILYIRKCDKSVKILEEWKDLMFNHCDLFAMDIEHRIIDESNPYFIQNRNDQTCLGLLAWKYKEDIMLLKPDFDWIGASRLSNYEIRMSHNDILPCRKKFDYKPYVMFVAGHVIPQYEKDYDDYTHFIDVGNNNLDRCTCDTGDNICELNDLAEETALYWIWKNVDLSDVKYVGFSTYRKPFMLDNGDIYNLLENCGYDCVAVKHYQNRKDIHLKIAHYTEEIVSEFDEYFGKSHPEDKEDFINHKMCGYIYPCNSFVMKRDDFIKMCEYVFSVTIPYAKDHIGLHGITSHSPCAGVFAEEVVSIFIDKYMKNIKSVPFLMYSYYNRFYNVNVAQPEPILWGSWINEKNQEMIWQYDGLPLMILFNSKNFSQQIKNNEFYEEGCKPKEKNIVITKKFVIDRNNS